MATEQDIRNQLEQLQLLRENVQFFRRQARFHGGAAAAPIATQRGLADTYAEIARCKAVLRGWDVLVEDLPDDVPAASEQVFPGSVFQLRAPVPDFVGRDAELERLVAALRPSRSSQAVAISGVRGMGGLGKTELAYAAAAQLVSDYPDGQILLELAGASPTPFSPALALQQVIRAFQPEDKLPEELPALEKLYRSVLASRRVLILADDARDAVQVRSLLPPTGSALLVTSRQRFILDGMSPLDLERLEEEAAVALLRGICSRLTEEHARQIARLCGHLPLALRVSAGILLNDPAFSPERYLARLASQPLAELRDPDEPARDVGAILRLSYAALDAPPQAVFRRLGVLAADADLPLIAAVLELSEEETDEVLRSLLRRSLVEYDEVRQRWGMHDLVRACALGLLTEAGEERAVRLHYTKRVITLIDQSDQRYEAGGDGVLTGLALFDRERAHLEAVRVWLWAQPSAVDIDQLVISEANAAVFIGELRDSLRAVRVPQLERALAVTRRLGDRAGEGMALGNLGIAYSNLGEVRRAIELYEQHLAIARELGDRAGEGAALGNLGIAYWSLGEARRAIELYEQDLAVARELGNRTGEGRTLGNLGVAYSNLGEVRRAIELYEQHLAIARELGDQAGEGRALGNLGVAYLDLGEVRRAIELYEQYLAIARELGDRRDEGQALGNLGNAYLDLGEVRRAIDFHKQYLAIARELGDRAGEGRALGNLGNAYRDMGEVRRAIELYEQHLAITREVGNRRGEGIALGNLGLAWETLEDYAQAHRCYEEQLRISREIGDRSGEASALDNLGRTFYLLGDAVQARTHCEEALALARDLEDCSLEGTALRDLANALAALDQPAEADVCYIQSLAIHDELGSQSEVARTRWAYGQFLIQQGERERGLALLDDCVAYEQQIGYAQAVDHAAFVKKLRAEGA